VNSGPPRTPDPTNPLATPPAALPEGDRLVIDFTRDWRFLRQRHGVGEMGSFDRRRGPAALREKAFEGVERADYDDDAWESVALPHTWNAHDVMEPPSGYWRGIGWYRKRFRLGEAWRGKRVHLRFEGVNQSAVAWLNGRELGSHKGGYTPFEFDATPCLLEPGVGNVITVQVDNVYDPDLPPTVKTDINFYGGIYRKVWLLGLDPLFLHSVWVFTPRVSREEAVVRARAEIRQAGQGSAAFTVRHRILDPHGCEVAAFETRGSAPPGGTATVEAESPAVASPLLWSPDSPSLYRVESTLWAGGKPTDRLVSPLGFRWFRFDPDRGFFLNGERLQIQGTNRHQVYPGMGNALPDSRHRLDVENMKAMGVNFWRTSHYPHADAAIDACDRLGILVLEEVPVMKEVGHPERYIANATAMAREMIQNHRNHPSIVLWGIAGEVDAAEEISFAVAEALAATFRSEDPIRLATMHSPRSGRIEALVDVIGTGLERADADRAHHPDRCYMVSEYSASLSGRGLHDGEPYNEEDSNRAHEEYVRGINRREWLAGGALWNQFDWDGETYDVVFPRVTAFGMCDSWRIPKDVYFFYKSQWNPEPMVHICSHWTWPGREGRRLTVKVYSNAEEVELFLNDRSLGRRPKTTGDGLRHPPFIFEVPYAPGTLRAEGVFPDGNRLADLRRTAGPAFAVRLNADPPHLTVGDSDSVVYITASIVDRNGTLVPGASVPVTFSHFGCGRLLAQNWMEYGPGYTWRTVAGLTRIALQADDIGGRAVVRALSPGLVMGRLIVPAVDPARGRDPFRFWRDRSTAAEEDVAR